MAERLGHAARDPVRAIRRSRLISCIVGVVVVSASIFVGNISGNLLEVTNKAANLLVAPLFILFFMAMFVPFATPVGTIVGAIASTAAAVGVAFFGIFGLNFHESTYTRITPPP